MTSRIPGFHALSRADRLAKVAEMTGLTNAELDHLTREAEASGDLCDHLAENVVSVMSIPLGVATNVIVDGVDVLVPMATEEASVVAAVCNGARACRETGGFTTSADAPRMIAQIQITDLSDPHLARARVLEHEADLKALCDAVDPMLVTLGGGFRMVEARVAGGFLIVHLIVDVRDAMGANAVNTMAETCAPHLEGWSGGTARLRILSNLADRRLVRARATWPVADLGAETVQGILEAYAFAACDPYRAATHNKGIMNGISAVGMATGQDTRALEAGAHAYAATRPGGYGPLTTYERAKNGDLIGMIECPMPVGIVGGATRAHPTARSALKIMGVTGADRLARVMAAVGLVQNFSALRALATEGIQRGHMTLHARNLAVSAGAHGTQIGIVAAEMVARKSVREETARAILATLGT